jgi:hypothetical protein
MDTHQNSVEVQPSAKDADVTIKQKIAKHRSHTATTVENTEQMTQSALKAMYKYNEIHRNRQQGHVRNQIGVPTHIYWKS